MSKTFKKFQRFWKMAMPIQNTVEKSKISEMKAELSEQLKHNIMWICYRNMEGEHEVVRTSHMEEHQPKIKSISPRTTTSTCMLFDITDKKHKIFKWSNLVTYQIESQHGTNRNN